MENLFNAMRKNGVLNKDLSEALSLADRTISNKLSGKTDFTVKEALIVRDTFFPGMKIEYLFGDEPK